MLPDGEQASIVFASSAGGIFKVKNTDDRYGR
jgi:hypothetical protein